MPTDRQIALFENFISESEFPCVGAKSALARDSLTWFRAPSLNSSVRDIELYGALSAFGRTLDPESPLIRSFIVIFDGPGDMDEIEFERVMWDRLQCLHNIDVAAHSDWSAGADADPKSEHFSFSLNGEAYFVIGLHPNASRPGRRFAYPALVFNSHAQFEKLRADEKYDRMKEIIRQRDLELAGDINPMLDDFGVASEARQYSGRAVDESWTCPFEPKVSLNA